MCNNGIYDNSLLYTIHVMSTFHQIIIENATRNVELLQFIQENEFICQNTWVHTSQKQEQEKQELKQRSIWNR